MERNIVMSDINNENKQEKIDASANTANNTGNGGENRDVIVSKEDLANYIEEVEREAKRTGRWQGLLVSLLGCFVVAIGVAVISIISNVFFKNANIDGDLINKDVANKADYLYSAIDKYFLWDTDVDEARENIYKGIFESLDDPYSVYYTKEEYDELMESNSGQYSGIGAYISQNVNTNELSISKPMTGSPAEKAGILAGDIIIEVDGENVEGQDINIVVSKIKGERGTTVNIGIRRDNKKDIITIPVVRDTIEVEMVESDMLDDNVGYLYINSFEQTTYSQFVNEYEKLKDQGMKSLIIDLRDNPGGDLDIVVKIADYILPKGTIVYTKDKNGKGERYNSDEKCIDIPLVVLVNKNSASASEILAGSIKDYQYGTLVGETTFGKGIVQAVIGIRDGSGFKVTESEYYLPNDECIHKVGIEPDIKIELDTEKYLKEKIDNQKNKAWEIAKKKQQETQGEEQETVGDTTESTK